MLLKDHMPLRRKTKTLMMLLFYLTVEEQEN